MADNTTSQCVPDYLLNGFYMGYVRIPTCVVGACLNLLSITTIRSNRKLHTNTNMVIVSVALADVLLSVGYISSLLLHFPLFSSRLLNAFLVDSGIMGITYSSIMLSLSQMCVIAIDRYIYIVHPFVYRKHVTNRRGCMIICSLWLVAILYAMIPLFVYTNSVYHEKCILRNPPREYFYPMAVGYYVTCAVIICLYLKIAVLAFRRKQAASSRKISSNDVVNVITLPQTRSSALKSVKFFAVVCGLYICFTSPGCSALLLNPVYHIPRFLLVSLLYLYMFHSMVHFFVYLNMNKAFRQALKKKFDNVRKTRCCQ